MAAIRKTSDHHWEVFWYVDRSRKSKWFTGADRYQEVLDFKREMDLKYPNKSLIKNGIKATMLTNKSGINGVCFEENKRTHKGVTYSYPCWTAFIERGVIGEKIPKIRLRFLISKEITPGGAKQDAINCRKMYEKCIVEGTMALFWRIYSFKRRKKV